ncbi:MAG: glycosyltransferase [bacterium]
MVYDLLLLNMSREADWRRGVVNRNAAIASELRSSRRIRKILSIDFLPHTYRRALRVWWQDVRDGHVGGKEQASLLTRFSSLDHERRYHCASIVPIFSEEYFLRMVERFLRQHGFSETILWSYLPTYVKAFTRLPVRLSVFDAVDDWSCHPAYRSLRNALNNNYRFLEEHAGTIFTVSRELKNKFPHHRAVHWIPNGVDVNRFATREPLSPYGTEQRPRIVYVGVIQERVDLALLAWLARERPGYLFVLIGPVWRGMDITQLQKLSNVRFLGFQPANRVPALLHHASVGIVPHRHDTFVESMNPMKIYEYLAAGLPVVATHAEGFERYAPAVRRAKRREDFLAALDEWITRPPPPDICRSLVQRDRWSDRFASMWDILAPSLT